MFAVLPGDLGTLCHWLLYRHLLAPLLGNLLTLLPIAAIASVPTRADLSRFLVNFVTRSRRFLKIITKLYLFVGG